MKRKTLRTTKHKWTFEPNIQRFMTHMLRMRLSNKAIMHRTGFTLHQITYAAHKYKVSAGMKMSLRQRWAAGLDPLIDDLLADRVMIEAMDAEIDRKVIPRIIHPTPQTIRIKD